MKTIEELAREAGLDSCMHVNAELESLARFAALVRAQAFKDAYNAVLDMEKGDKAVRLANPGRPPRFAMISSCIAMTKSTSSNQRSLSASSTS